MVSPGLEVTINAGSASGARAAADRGTPTGTPSIGVIGQARDLVTHTAIVRARALSLDRGAPSERETKRGASRKCPEAASVRRKRYGRRRTVTAPAGHTAAWTRGRGQGGDVAPHRGRPCHPAHVEVDLKAAVHSTRPRSPLRRRLDTISWPGPTVSPVRSSPPLSHRSHRTLMQSIFADSAISAEPLITRPTAEHRRRRRHPTRRHGRRRSASHRSPKAVLAEEAVDAHAHCAGQNIIRGYGSELV